MQGSGRAAEGLYTVLAGLYTVRGGLYTALAGLYTVLAGLYIGETLVCPDYAARVLCCKAPPAAHTRASKGQVSPLRKQGVPPP
jgi:hypothetical protein